VVVGRHANLCAYRRKILGDREEDDNDDRALVSTTKVGIAASVVARQGRCLQHWASCTPKVHVLPPKHERFGVGTGHQCPNQAELGLERIWIRINDISMRWVLSNRAARDAPWPCVSAAFVFGFVLFKV
jgi:hypothetical protein